MLVTTDRRSLLSAAAGVADAVARRTTKEVLRCVRATATPDGKLTLEATDTDTGVRLEVAGADVATAGRCLVPAAKLIEWLKAAKDGPVSLAADDGKGVTLKAGRAKLDLPWFPVDEFPDPIPEVKPRATVQTTAAAFLAAWSRVAFCRERKESTSYVTRGVGLDVDGGAVRLVATDSRRCGVCVIDGAAVEQDRPASLILPAGFGKLLEGVAGGEDAVTLEAGPGTLVATCPRGAVATGLIAGQFPPWRVFVDKSRAKKALKFDADAGDLGHAVAQAAVTTDDESRSVSAAFRPGRATLTSRGVNEGAGEVELELPGYDGPELGLRFDPDHVAEFLAAAGDAGAVRLEIANPEKPVFLSCPELPGWTYLFVPLAG